MPGVLAFRLLSIVHGFFPTFGLIPPPRASPEFRKHVRWAYSAVVFGYAFFTFYWAASSIELNYYQVLGLDPTADDAELKTAFRVFAKRYHPDRAGPEGETFFMHIRNMFEALKDPVTRFAYDRCAFRVFTLFHQKNIEMLSIVFV